MNVSPKALKETLAQALDQSVMKKDGKPDKIRKFDETIDLIVNIRDVDIKNPNNRIDQEILLPHGIPGNKSLNDVCFIAKDDMELVLKKKGYKVIDNRKLLLLFTRFYPFLTKHLNIRCAFILIDDVFRNGS